MMKEFKYILVTILCLSFGQNDYQGPDDNAGDPSAIKESWMDGNKVLLYFKNTSELSDWAEGGLDNVSIWPNDGTGTRMVDGIGLLIGAKVYILDDENPETTDTIVVDNWTDILNQDIKKHEVYFCKLNIGKKWIKILLVHLIGVFIQFLDILIHIKIILQ